MIAIVDLPAPGRPIKQAKWDLFIFLYISILSNFSLILESHKKDGLFKIGILFF